MSRGASWPSVASGGAAQLAPQVGNGCGASQPAVASGRASPPAQQELVDEIIHLGRMPTQSKNASIAEKRLARRLIYARKAGSLTRAQEAALDNLAQASGASQPDVARGGAGQTAQQKLMDEIIKLGHMPIRAKTASAEEKKLAQRLWHARRVGSLTKEQEAALDKLPHARKTKSVEQSKEKGGKDGGSSAAGAGSRLLPEGERRA